MTRHIKYYKVCNCLLTKLYYSTRVLYRNSNDKEENIKEIIITPIIHINNY